MEIEKYLTLAKSSTSEKTLTPTIETALKDPRVFAYGELLNVPGIDKC